MESLGIIRPHQGGAFDDSDQQPLSLMTINLNPNRKEDQLIISILEASERKKQLIKKLLSPEEYESIAFDQYWNYNTQTTIESQPRARQHQVIELDHSDYREKSPVKEAKIQIELESKIPKTNTDLHSNLAKKREALDFFFKEQSNPPLKQDNLAIELRSGYYLNAQHDETDKVLKSQPFSLMDRMIGLLGFMGINFSTRDPNGEEEEDQFVRLQDGIKQCRPYARERNFEVMRTRLEADGDMEKFLKGASDSDSQSQPKQPELVDLVDLIKKHKNQTDITSGNVRLQIILVEPAGHFNTMQLVKSVIFAPRAELLVLEPQVPRPFWRQGQRQDLAKLNLLENDETMKLRLSRFVITNHKLMLPEERAVIRVIYQLLPKERSAKVQRDKLLMELDKHAKLYVQSRVDLPDVRFRLKETCEALIEALKQLLVAQHEILVTASEIESLRKEQKFNSTSFEINYLKLTQNNSPRDSINSIVDSFKTKLKQPTDELEKFYKQFLDEYEKCVDSEQAISVNLKSNDTTQTVNKWPPEEVERRRQVQDWLKSLRLRFLLGSQYFYECKLRNNSSSLVYTISMDHQLTLSIPQDDNKLALKLELYRVAHQFMPINWLIEAESNIQLATNESQTHQVTLNLNDEISSAQLELVSDSSLDEQETQPNKQRCKSVVLLDKLYKKIFKTDCWDNENLETKFARLLNKCDNSILIQLLGHPLELPPERFELNPFIEHIDTAVRSKTARQAVLMWRWTNNNNQQLVYLSECENIKNYSLQLEEFKCKLDEVLAVERQESGYRAIEQTRAQAVEYIKQYEAQLKEILKYKANELDRQQSSSKLSELLREPELRVDFSGVARTACSFVPKRSAHRPLLPRRTLGGGSTARTFKGIAQSLVASQPVPIDSAREAQNLDTHWQRLVSSQGVSRLQLVVTIQQATNLPMRVLQAPAATTTRPNSPFASASPATSFMTQMIQPATSVQYLAPPTSYVEIVFQRRQQASSLAQGKSPAWNQTLFFPVDLPDSNVDSQRQEGAHSKDQLVDEFLQLNLYDYHCYSQESIDQGRSEQELSTLAMVSDRDPGLDFTSASSSIIKAQRIQAARQRIERHLLGSLRVPLSTLMSSGRIEGTFALKQPLLMENYQFEPEILLSNDLMRAASMIPSRAASPQAILNPETHISLFITLDPPVSMPIHLLHLPTGSYESERVLELARLWELVVVHHRRGGATSGEQQSGPRPFGGRARNNHRPRLSRHVRALVLQRDAKYCLISRLLVPLPPPAELLEELDKSDKRAAMAPLARFVALLSPLKYGLFGMRLLASSLWFDSAQLIDKSLGGPEEKAVLLCNYFLHLGFSSALLLGDAVPEGRCVYVIVWHEQSQSHINDQLQLQAATLLESINNLTSGSNSNRAPSELSASTGRLIDRSDFISRLPIIMSANSTQIWDPNLGKSYSLAAQRIPLTSVGSIVTMENVYANIQSVESPAETNYDLRFKHHWFPLFESASSATTGGLGTIRGLGMSSTLSKSLGATRNPQLSWRRQLIQLEALRKTVERPNMRPLLSSNISLNYSKFSLEECNQLRDAIERVIKSYLLKWRPNRPTYFNRTLSRLLADKLALFESYTNSQGNDQKADWQNELSDLIKNEVLMAHLSSSGLNTRQVISCPINLPYTSTKTIVDSIFASGVHNADLMLDSNQHQSNSSTQFLVACHVHPYPARVMSVWLYVAAIIPNPRGLSRLLMA